MKKLFLLLLLIPLLAFKCEGEEPCFPTIKQIYKPNLITVENLQTTYNLGDIIWFNSTLDRNQTFENPTETIDLFSYPLEYSWGVQFYRSSVYNSEIYLCLDSTTTEITNGSINNCNLFEYEKVGDVLKSRVGIKILETGVYKINLYKIATFRNEGLNCDDKGLDISTTLSNNNQQTINFTVE
ncbi:hypothetical protein ACFSX9_11450 [Flavobacterium ardleyense]|uniref:Lipoprotein n=1 Tax=Flavobacterium ardleyense TaxID=2038737 RepID=A0ABW5Z9M1_9FLAO